jgi:hypothetical protein
MDNVQKHNICTNVPSSETFRSHLPVSCSSLHTYTIFSSVLGIVRLRTKSHGGSVALSEQSAAVLSSKNIDLGGVSESMVLRKMFEPKRDEIKSG